MPFPANRVEMQDQGYRFINAGRCRGCDAKIEWWVTPDGKKSPMNPMPDDQTQAISHFASCPDVEMFRGGA